jgi:NAD(P)-dependent dehydrogenase (short-subunit alcohol dehydrogenase family)
MITREQINDRIEAYAKAVRDRNPEAVSQLFAERFDHIVHGAGADPANPWNTKRETEREGIRRIYEDFFSKVADMTVEYTDRIIDTNANSAAMVVRVRIGSNHMENALHIKWNDNGEIIAFYNWYGQASD